MTTEATARPPVGPETEQETDLGAYVATLMDNRWLISGAVAVMVLLGGLYTFVAQPTYEADILLQVEEKGGGMSGLEDLSSVLKTAAPAETEIEIIRSRLLLGSVIDELHLDVAVQPRYFPIIGTGIARRYRGREVAAPLFGLSRYAWGGERVSVDRLDVPEPLEDEPLVLTAGADGTFELADQQGATMARGKVGQPAEGEDLGGGRASIFVSELKARPGTEFRVTRLSRGKAIGELQRTLSARERGRKTGIIGVTLEGPDPRRLTATLNAVARAYVRKNVERKSAEAEKTLEFVNAQLPSLREDVDKAEEALNAYRSQRGTIDVGLETKGMLDRVVEVERQITALNLEASELKQRYTDSHPMVEALKLKMARLEAERSTVNAQFKRLPDAELRSARLMRDVKVANELYVLLLNKSQELKVVKSGTVGNVRIIDEALMPRRPVRPRLASVVALCLVFGLAMGVTLAFVRRSLDHGVVDPEEIERALGTPVYANVPFSERQGGLVRAARAKGNGAINVLALHDPGDLAVESLRSLRTSLQFALMDAKNNVMAISGPKPAIGKSFISVNLAHVLADAGKRVLLVDGDMRKGRLHTYMNVDRSPGLSEIISGTVELDQAIRRATAESKVDFVPTGIVPPNPAELLLSARFQQLLATTSEQYDIVLIDTPPILAVTDGAIIGKHAGVNLMVVRAGEHPMREIAVALKRFEQSGVRPQGMIFNGVTVSRSSLGRYAYSYQYEYR